MRQVHSREKEQFKKLFKQENVDNIDDRFKVLKVFLQTEKHVTASELVEIVYKRGYFLESEFVKETLNLLCSFGFAKKNQFNDDTIRYEHRHLGQHHDHMICTKCQKVTEFQNEHMEALKVQIASDMGFHMLQHKMEIYGICSNCLKERVKLMPLATARPGEKVFIRKFVGGIRSRMRILAMGLRIEDKIEVITNHGKGQIIVSAGFNRFILGRNIAKKIMVEHVV
mmetsp:Transcript_21263/g.9781  ORF Transcript_21263/g.9781 Transcript_21263/m.9781 type:complete len:226 (-) Transcript_21263:87-764(-)